MTFLALKDRPIRGKLMLLMMSTVLLAIAALGSVFIVYEYHAQKYNMEQEYSSTAKIIADRSTAALMFLDTGGLHENLSSLKVKTDVLVGCMYNTQELLASFEAKPDATPCPQQVEHKTHVFSSTTYTHVEPVTVDGKLEGYVMLRVSLERLYQQLGFYVMLVFLFGSIVGIFAFFLSRILQEYIAEPLIRLTETAEQISSTQDYALLADKESNDEIGQLVEAFNSMLQTIQKKNQRIMDNAAELESKVKERTEELAQTKKELAIATKELEAFSYSVSHDLRSPLRAIDGFTRALEEDYAEDLDDLARSYIQCARGAAQKMGALIATLLQLSRVSRKELQPEPLDMTALAERICQQLQDAEAERQVRVTVQSQMHVDADEQLMDVALNNLLGNAWKYSSKQAHAQIDVGMFSEGGTDVYYVKDNGAGFDKTYAADLFTAFKRLHTEDEFEGTGIGLATVARAIHRHHGEIWATSELGQGACFYFTLNAFSCG